MIELAEDATRRSFGVWLPLALRGAAAVLVLASALVAGRRVPRGSTTLGVAGPAAVVLALVVVLSAFREALPVAASASPPVSVQEPVITGHPLLLIAQSLGAGCFLVASLMFTVQARRQGRTPATCTRSSMPAIGRSTRPGRRSTRSVEMRTSR